MRINMQAGKRTANRWRWLKEMQTWLRKSVGRTLFCTYQTLCTDKDNCHTFRWYSLRKHETHFIGMLFNGARKKNGRKLKRNTRRRKRRRKKKKRNTFQKKWITYIVSPQNGKKTQTKIENSIDISWRTTNERGSKQNSTTSYCRYLRNFIARSYRIFLIFFHMQF